VRWNPVDVDPQPARVAGSGDVRVYAKVPRSAPKAGEFKVSRPKLVSTFGPSFIHTLDSMFCGLVVEQLAARGVRDPVAIHDAWLVPADAADELRAAVEEASRQWYKRLGGVYDELERLLGTCTPAKRGRQKGRCCGYCANWIRELREGWQQRIADGNWPEFRVGAPEVLIGR
jgi:hypothetical protein